MHNLVVLVLFMVISSVFSIKENNPIIVKGIQMPIVVKNASLNELLILSKNVSYANYIKALTKMYPIMVYSLPNCLPCENAKLLLKTYYSDVPFHYLDTALVKGWHEKMYQDLQRVTGSPWFPYIFACGEYIGGAMDLMNLHLKDKLRPKLETCYKKSEGYIAPEEEGTSETTISS